MYKSIIFVQLCIVVCTIIASSNAASFWDSMVNVDRSDQGKETKVHVPFFYWMDSNRNREGPKLDISVLGGLVKVNVDRHKNADGRRPVMVRLLGQKIFNSFPDGLNPANAVLSNGYGDNQLQGEGSSKEVIAFKPNDYKPIEPIVAQESVKESVNTESSSIIYDATVTQDSSKTD